VLDQLRGFEQFVEFDSIAVSFELLSQLLCTQLRLVDFEDRADSLISYFLGCVLILDINLLTHLEVLEVLDLLCQLFYVDLQCI
jgi:hypothetical protein